MKKVILFGTLIGGGVLLFHLTGLTDQLQNVSVMQTWFRQQGLVGYLVFILLCIITAVFMLPGGLLAVIAGVAFGGWLGGSLTVIGSTIGASLSFLLGAYVIKRCYH